MEGLLAKNTIKKNDVDPFAVKRSKVGDLWQGSYSDGLLLFRFNSWAMLWEPNALIVLRH